MALNIPSLQQLATPVSSARRADMERQNLRIAAQQEEMNRRQLASMDQPNPEIIGKFMTDARSIADQMIAYEDSLKEKDLSEDERNSLLQSRFSSMRQMIIDNYGESFGATFDDDAEYDSEGMRAWLGQVSDEGDDYTLSPGAARFNENNERVALNPSSNAPEVVFNMGPGEDAATSEYGKTVGQRAASRDDLAAQAVTQNSNLERMLLALERGAQTGLGEETILNIKSLANTLLLPINITEEDGEQEIVRKIANEMALMMRNPDSGLGLTGNTSNRDLQFLRDSVPGLQRTEEGNRLIIDYAMRVNRMKLDIAAEQSRIISENEGVVPGDLDKKIMDFVNEYDLFTDQERALIEAARDSSSESSPRVLNFADLPN